MDDCRLDVYQIHPCLSERPPVSERRRWTMLRICINGKPLDVAAGETLLTSARLAGIHIPTLCADPRVKPLGACRMCLVQVEGERRPVAACSTLVREGMKVE